MDTEAERQARAERRRAGYPGSVTRPGEEKPFLYEGKTALERLALMTALVEQQAGLSDSRPAPIPRSEWPGEVFDIDERNRRTGR